MTAMRVSPPKVFPGVSGAPRPAPGSPAADAFRQTGFVLGGEVDLVLRGLALESSVAEASAGAKYRKQPTAAALGLWSRSWLTRLDALHALQGGNYAAALPLVRAAADYAAAELALLQSDAAEWVEWLDSGGVALAPTEHALEFRLHAFRSGEALAALPDLGRIYRTVTDLSLSHFGSTVLVAGSESDPARIAMTFGDRDFHLGLAEILLAWLAELSVIHLDGAAAAPASFAPPPEGRDAFAREAAALAARRDRCRIESAEVGGQSRYLIANWRRTPGAAPKRVLL